MATDATGTPTAKGIPKYNTAVDAPSGKGFNAAMDAIDTLLDDYAQAPSGIATGEAMVWNGTAWARSSVTRLTTVRPQDLGQDSAVTGQGLVWNGSIWAPGSISPTIDRVSTDTTFASSTAENTLYTKTITANTMGANGILRLTIYGLLSTNAGTDTERIRIKFGATTFIDTGAVAFDNGGASTNVPFHLEVRVQNDAATNANTVMFYMVSGTRGNTNLTTGTGKAFQNGSGSAGGRNTGAVDTTSNQDLVVTWQHGTNSANCSVTLYSALLELL